MIELRARNAGATTQTLHVLPTLWFRNTWAWGITDTMPALHVENGRVVADHTVVGRMFLTGDGDYTTLVCDNESNAERLWGSTSRSSFPKDGINDHVVHAATTVNPAQVGTKAALHYRVLGRSRTERRDQAPIRPPRDRRGRRCSGGARASPQRSRRLLREPHARPAHHRRAAGCPSGAQRHALGQAVLSLQRDALARRRSGRAAAAPGTPHGTQRRMASRRHRGRALDARQVGVPVVRRLGPGLSVRRARARRSRVRQGAAHPALPRVVHARQRPAARVRVVVRRRQPTGARVGRAARLRDRRRDATTSSSRASSTSCSSTSRGGSIARTPRATTSSRAASSASTTSVRSTARRCFPRAATSSSPTAPPGWRCTRSTSSRWR